jgi:hypothetical protein
VKNIVGGFPLNYDLRNLISLIVGLKTLYGNLPFSRFKNA